MCCCYIRYLHGFILTAAAVVEARQGAQDGEQPDVCGFQLPSLGMTKWTRRKYYGKFWLLIFWEMQTWATKLHSSLHHAEHHFNTSTSSPLMWNNTGMKEEIWLSLEEMNSTCSCLSLLRTRSLMSPSCLLSSSTLSSLDYKPQRRSWPSQVHAGASYTVAIVL